MNRIIFIGTSTLCLLPLLIFDGCATPGKSTGMGAAVGAGTGMAIGAIADPGRKGENRTRNVIIGGAVGTVAGAVAGALLHSASETQKSEAFKAGQDSVQPIDPNQTPNLRPAQWRAEVVEAKRIGNRFIPRHIEYVITEPAQWEE